jgi:hypothetical protein
MGRVDSEGTLTDDAALVGLLDQTLTPETSIEFEYRLRLVAWLYVRAVTNNVSAALPDPERDPALLYAQWDGAYCYWDGLLRDRSIAADDAAFTTYDALEADTVGGFELGNASVEGPAPWAPDEFLFPSAKQIVEKTGFAVHHRNVVTLAAAAAEDGADAELLAAQALGEFQLLEDRIQGRNTPGIAIIEDMLGGAPADIDAVIIEEEMNIAFAKRTRTYCDHALDLAQGPGTAAGVKGAYEGRTYAKLIAYDVGAKVEGVTVEEYLAAWDDYVEAIEGADEAGTSAASADLVAWTCAYQAALGITACTSNQDEAP